MKIGKIIEGYKYEPQIKNWVKWDDICSGWSDLDGDGLSYCLFNGISICNKLFIKQLTSIGSSFDKITNTHISEENHINWHQ